MTISVKRFEISLFFPILFSFLTSCGSYHSEGRRDRNLTSASQHASGMKSSDAVSDVPRRGEDVPQMRLVDFSSTALSLDTFATFEFENTDFVQMIRCSSELVLKTPTGSPARDQNGNLISISTTEAEAIWNAALSDVRHCRLIGERLIRISFSDPFGQSGDYFYLFNPCQLRNTEESVSPTCSFQLVSTPNVALTNNMTFERSKLLYRLNQSEAKLSGLTLKMRSQLFIALEAQKSCELNAAVDAVKEARSKALATLLGTGVASVVGAIIAGPSGAVSLAQQTLHWIVQYFGPGTQNNPANCKILKDAEAVVENLGGELAVLRNEIGQIQSDLAKL